MDEFMCSILLLNSLKSACRIWWSSTGLYYLLDWVLRHRREERISHWGDWDLPKRKRKIRKSRKFQTFAPELRMVCKLFAFINLNKKKEGDGGRITARTESESSCSELCCYFSGNLKSRCHQPASAHRHINFHSSNLDGLVREVLS